MIFIYKITEVNFCMPLRKYQDMTLTENDAVSSPLSLRPNRKLILIAILLKISKINLKIMFILKYKNKHFDRNYPMGIFA